MIVDIHVHPPHGDGSEAALDHMAEVAAQVGITHICLQGRVTEFGPNPDPEGITAINNDSVDLVGLRPEVYSGFCYLNPEHDVPFIRDELTRTVAEGPLVGIKLWHAVNCRDARLDPIMERAAQLDVPILHHAWYKSTGQNRNESTPADIADLGRRFPEVSIIMAHLSGSGCRGVADIKPYPNVSIDTCGSQPEHGFVEYAVAQLGAKRVVFGSDAPGRDFSCQLGRVLAADITDKQRRTILTDNGARLLGLEAAE
ncbi:MAG: amidohydrolase family protein [Armatimonadota bacterium]